MLNKLVFVFSLLRVSQGTVPYLCENDFLETSRGSDAIFTCSRLDASKGVDWTINGKLLSCGAFSSQKEEETCDKAEKPNTFIAKRTSAESSDLIVHSSYLSKTKSISCEISGTEEKTTCKVDLIYDDVNVTLASKNVEGDVGSVTNDYTKISAGVVSYVNVTNSNDNISTGYPGDVSITTDNADVIRDENVTGVSPDYVSVRASLTSQKFVLKEKNGSATTSRRDISGWIAGGVCGGLFLVTIIGVALFCFLGRKKETTNIRETRHAERSAPQDASIFILALRSSAVNPI